MEGILGCEGGVVVHVHGVLGVVDLVLVVVRVLVVHGGINRGGS